MENENKPKQILPPAPAPEIKNGRPTTYTIELGNKICYDIACNTEDSMPIICARYGTTYSSFKDWLRVNDEFAAQYTRAKAEQMEAMEDLYMQISKETPPLDTFGKMDMGFVQDKKVRLDALKWLMGKRASKVYGEKNEVNVKVDMTKPMTENQFGQFMAKLEELVPPPPTQKQIEEIEEQNSEYESIEFQEE